MVEMRPFEKRKYFLVTFIFFYYKKPFPLYLHCEFLPSRHCEFLSSRHCDFSLSCHCEERSDEAISYSIPSLRIEGLASVLA
jgi:hypothetical protein